MARPEKSRSHLEVALIKVPREGTSAKARIVGVSRDPRLSMAVREAIREELEESMQKINSVTPGDRAV